MKRGSAIILRGAIFVAGIAVLALCGVITWAAIMEWNFNSEYRVLMYALPAGIYACAIPFFIALHRTLKLLNYIDSNRAFSELSVKALTTIMYCAVSVFIICTVGGLPFFYCWAQMDDAPGLVFIGMAISGAAFVIAVFSSVLKRRLQDAIFVKTENDLTV